MATKQDAKDKQSAAKNDKNDQKNTSSKAAETETRIDSQELDSLQNLLEGDLTEVDTDEAFGTIDEWHATLNKSKEPELKELASSLKELKQLLKGGKATGHEIGELLSYIGDQTVEIAANAEKGSKTAVQKLGKQLSKAGYAIGKAEDKESAEQLESLSETLEGDLTQVDTNTAVGAIDHWYAILNKSESENLKAIAESLKELKQLLKRKNADASAIAEALTKLGEQTTEAASEVHRGLKGSVRNFGKLLSKTGKSLESE